jgi:hypothetical protein
MKKILSALAVMMIAVRGTDAKNAQDKVSEWLRRISIAE